MKVTKELERQAWLLYLDGCTRLKIHRATGIPLRALTRFIEKGNPQYGKRPWRDRRADIYRRREETEDGTISKAILQRSALLSDIERRGLKKLQRRVRNSRADKDLTVNEIGAVSRAANDALRLAVDSARAIPQTQINVNTSASAFAGSRSETLGALPDGNTGVRLTEATIQALQQATPEEQKALRAWQKKFTLAMEEKGLLALPANDNDEMNEVVDAVVDEKETGT